MEQQEWFSQHCFIVVVLVNHGLDLSTKRLPSRLVGQCSMPHQGSYDLYCTEPSSLSVPPLLVLPPSLHVHISFLRCKVEIDRKVNRLLAAK